MSLPSISRLTIALLILGAASVSAQQAPPAPKPGPEHAVLKMEAGVWDAVVEFVMAPGAPAQTSKGVETNVMGCGGLCLITEFKGEAMGSPFSGHGLATWDAAKKKYVGSWTDSMSSGLAIAEMTHDPATKKSSGWMEGPDMNGKVTRTRSQMEWKDNDTRVQTAWATGPDGKEVQVMKITYTRRK